MKERNLAGHLKSLVMRLIARGAGDHTTTHSVCVKRENEEEHGWMKNRLQWRRSKDKSPFKCFSFYFFH